MAMKVDAPPEARTPEVCLPPDFRKRLFVTSEASRYLEQIHEQRCKPSTLKKMRHTGGGPAFRRVGRDVRYERVALDEWAQGRLSDPITSTSEA